jgi:hypothetical protein
MRLKESINQNQINLLKATYGDIKKINPNSAAVKKLMMVLKKLSKDDLETISKAKINFVSTMAQSILRDYNVSESAEMDNLQKRKNDLLKQVDPLIAKKKKLYSDVDITTPKSSDEKKLDKEIADLFSEINDLVHKIVKLKKSQKEDIQPTNEAASRTAMEIGDLTGLNKDAVQKFVDTHNLDIEVVYQYIKKSKITDRLNFVTAVVGTPGNPFQKRMIKMFGESINEAVSKTFKIPTQRGILQLEVEEDPAGIFVDVIFNKVDIATTDIQFPTGEVKITQKQKRVKLTESIKESAKKSTFTKVARISNNGKLHIY